MKKWIVIIGAVCVLAILILAILYAINVKTVITYNTTGTSPYIKGEMLSVQMELVGSASSDMQPLRERFEVGAKDFLVYWDTTNVKGADSSAITQQTLESTIGFTGPTDFDYDNYTLLCTVGMKVQELSCQSDTFYGSMYVLEVCFEEEYQNDMVYFYRIDKRNYVPGWIRSPCYMMQDGKRKYITDTVPLFVEEIEEILNNRALS